MNLTGLERIIEKIAAESLEKCNSIISDAKAKGDSILAEARAEAGRDADAAVALGKAEAEKIELSAKSKAESITRTRYLQVKNAVVNDIIAAAYERIESMDNEAYFDFLLHLCEKNAAEGEGVMYLSKRDLERLPADFEAKVNSLIFEKGALMISKTPGTLENGFILVYGDMEVNCTLRAVFDEKHDLLKDVLGRALFTE